MKTKSKRIRVKYLNKDILQSIRACETDEFMFNRALTDEFIESLDPKTRLPVMFSMRHDQYDGPYEYVIRCGVGLKYKGKYVQDYVDMPESIFRKLPQREIIDKR